MIRLMTLLKSTGTPQLTMSVRRILLRPSLWIAIVTTIAYFDWDALHGKWVYDDAGSVAVNIVVTGKVPWTKAFTRDFWGTPMNTVTSPQVLPTRHNATHSN
jgi:hypothetical protein